MKPHQRLITTYAAVTFCTTSAHAITILEDSFDRLGPISGSNPDIGTGWSGSGWSTDGTSLLVTSNTFVQAPLTILPNTTYFLSMDVTVTSRDIGWIGMAFSLPAFNAINGNAVGGIHHRGMAGPDTLQLFPPSGFSTQNIPGDLAFPKTLGVELVTGSSLTKSTTSWKLNGLSIGTSQPVDASGINGVVIQSNIGRGFVDNIRLTAEAVPEPSSLLLCGLGIFGFAARRKRP